MTKELFVSSTPHETKVGLVEDDQLAEIYLERENEYTLAGSIYKGRVTRVLPGMQSAFVDIGLERDAFLYVSDFMELEDSDEVEELPTGHAVSEPYRVEPAAPSENVASATPAFTASEETQPSREAGQASERSSETRDNRGNWRGRRRRGRGRRGDRMPDSKFDRPQDAARDATARESSVRESYSRDSRESSGHDSYSQRPQRPSRSDYGPPPGYQPILLPGESISKYQRMARAAEHSSETSAESEGRAFNVAPAGETTAESANHIEAIQADVREAEHKESNEENVESHPEGHREEDHRAEDHREEARRKEAGREESDPDLPAYHAEDRRATSLNAVLHEDEEEPAASKPEAEKAENEEALTAAPAASHQTSSAASPRTIEEEEIEEEEADLTSYVEELEEDAAFEELEEETHAAASYHEPAQEIVASGESAAAELPVEGQDAGVSAISAAAESLAPEEEDEEEEEAELEEAQAQAEALLDAESRGEGAEDARAEVRAPASTASYAQRPQRTGFDRGRGGFRGRRGGRRFRRRENFQVPQISDLLKEGQEILVQIAKEPIGKKGARITSHIALPGRFLVYMPTVNHTGVSRKISSEEERQRLKRIILSERENGHGGFIVRTAAQGASEDELRADIRFLKGLWTEIKNRAESDKSPALIYHDLNVVERVLRDQVTSDFAAIWVDTDEEYERIVRFANRFQPALVKRVKLYTKETPLFEQFGLTDEINKALKSKVWLKSGGYIVINQTEALVAIDVNTGKYVGKTARLEDTIVKTNVDAIKEIVRQVRLRDLGGIIVIDFIDMDERRNRQKVMQALEEALRSDRAPSKALQFNDFGLVAITRKRVKQSLERTIGAPCPYCQSTGFVKSVSTVCNEIYVEMRKIARHLEHADVMLRVNPEVAKALKSNNGRPLAELEELCKKTVIVKSDPALHQEQFDIN